MLVLVGSLTAFGPLCVDVYLPSLPSISTHLHASATAVQLSLTACLVGLASGQLVMGPISDALGRHKPLFVGLAVFVASSLACAFAPPLLRLGSWRTLFLGLGVVGLILLIAAALGLAETLPPSARQPLHLGSMARLVKMILRNRRFMAVTAAGGLAIACLFGYVGGSPFVLEGVYNLTPQQYSLTFALNAIGLVAASQLNARLIRHIPPVRVLRCALIVLAAASTTYLIVVLTSHPPLAAALACFILCVFGDRC
jgi:DHA1 family bicyclomycin/chloramphenicol resistance-like MFS transporter